MMIIKDKIKKNCCLICYSKTNFYFSKKYSSFPNSPFKDSLTVHYYKCNECGFVSSLTHREMSNREWEKLNSSWHHYFENLFEDNLINQPPYIEQVLAIILLSKNKLININDALDYAAGYGTLSKLLLTYFDKKILLFDKYVQDKQTNLNYINEQDLKKYELVINSAMFEHVLEREHLDHVNNLVDVNGVLMIHTVVCENIPEDPNWFYLDPVVHTSFHTNKSMNILMKQWGYESSIYSPQAKSWFLFKKDFPALQNLESKISLINSELQSKYFYFKEGFMDYWKGF